MCPSEALPKLCQCRMHNNLARQVLRLGSAGYLSHVLVSVMEAFRESTGKGSEQVAGTSTTINEKDIAVIP